MTIKEAAWLTTRRQKNAADTDRAQYLRKISKKQSPAGKMY